MSCRYSILAVDLDGTLFDRGGRVSTRNRAAIDAALEAGLTVVLATGRAYSESMRAIESLRHVGPVIAAGGSLLCDGRDGGTIERRVLRRDVVEQVAEVFETHGHRTLVLKDGAAAGYDYLVIGSGRLDAASAWWFEAHAVEVRYAGHAGEDPHPGESLRVGVVAEGEAVEPIAVHLRETLADRAFLQHWPAVTQGEPIGASTHLLEIFDFGVNKWTMLEHLCRREGVEPAAVAAIGDGLNDVEMLAGAGLGVAMANAHAPAREAADRITAHHDEDGVADAIERILDGAW